MLVRPGETRGCFEVELEGEIAAMIELAQCAECKKAAPNGTADPDMFLRLVKVFAGARNHREFDSQHLSGSWWREVRLRASAALVELKDWQSWSSRHRLNASSRHEFSRRRLHTTETIVFSSSSICVSWAGDRRFGEAPEQWH